MKTLDRPRAKVLKKPVEPTPDALNAALKAIEAAKARLLQDVQGRIASKALESAQAADIIAKAKDMVAKNAAALPPDIDIVSQNALLGLLKKNPILIAVLEAAVKGENAKEILAAMKLREEQKQIQIRKKSLQPTSEADSDWVEPDEDDVGKEWSDSDAWKKDEEGEDNEADLDEDPDLVEDPDEPDDDTGIDLEDFENDPQALQNAWLHDIDQLPSIADRATLLYAVSQIDRTNTGFINKAAASLVPVAQNTQPGDENQVWAQAGILALNNPSDAVFGSKISDGAPEILPVARDGAPFRLIEEVADRVEKKDSIDTGKPSLNLLLKNGAEMTAAPEAEPFFEPVVAQKATTTQSLFNTLAPQPTAAFFKTFSGNSSS